MYYILKMLKVGIPLVDSTTLAWFGPSVQQSHPAMASGTLTIALVNECHRVD
jgi:hypothetical protein